MEMYVRSASRTSSERVRCSAFMVLSTCAAISGGSEIVNVTLVLIDVWVLQSDTRSYIISKPMLLSSEFAVERLGLRIAQAPPSAERLRNFVGFQRTKQAACVMCFALLRVPDIDNPAAQITCRACLLGAESRNVLVPPHSHARSLLRRHSCG
jgi:hypothetical protein